MLDRWRITDADPVWDFSVEIRYDAKAGRPENNGDVYRADVMLRECGEAEAQWARDAVAAWERDEWQFVIIDVMPVHKPTGTVFFEQTQSLCGCDYGDFPGSGDLPGFSTTGRDYVRTAWVNEMIESARERATEALGKMA